MVLGQTFTSCNPMTASCSPDEALDSYNVFTDFTKGASNQGWTLAEGTSLTYGTNGAQFKIASDGQAPTISTDFHIFFGRIDVVMQAAPGQGIVSSIVLESADLDEIDWEIIGSDTTHAQSDYFGKGNTTAWDRAVYQNVNSPQTGFHTYSVDWSAERIIWLIDEVPVRTLNYADANGGATFPQTPMVVKLGNWAAGCSGCPQGTATWAGGYTDFSDAPFNMYVKSVNITNANPGKEYVWGDHSGSWQSISVVGALGSSSTGSSGNDALGSSSGNTTATVGTMSSTSTSASTKTHTSTSSSSSASSTKLTTMTVGGSSPVGTTTSSSSSTSQTATSSPSSSTSSAAPKISAASSLAVMLSLLIGVWIL